jgi:hypothetical protein
MGGVFASMGAIVERGVCAWLRVAARRTAREAKVQRFIL